MATKFMVGDLEVIGVSDGTIAFSGAQYFPGTTVEQWEAHRRWLDHDGNVVFEYGCFVVRSGDKRVLIDTGVGPVEIGPFKGGALMSDLASAGIKPEDIDEVFITHLHVDHCGSAALKDSAGEMRPAFPRATYRWTSAEHEFWHGEKGMTRPMRGTEVLEVIAPLYEASDRRDDACAGDHRDGDAGTHTRSCGDRAVVRDRAGVRDGRCDLVSGAAQRIGVVGTGRRRFEAGAADTGGGRAGGRGVGGSAGGEPLSRADVWSRAARGGAAVLGGGGVVVGQSFSLSVRLSESS